MRGGGGCSYDGGGGGGGEADKNSQFPMKNPCTPTHTKNKGLEIIIMGYTTPPMALNTLPVLLSLHSNNYSMR